MRSVFLAILCAGTVVAVLGSRKGFCYRKLKEVKIIPNYANNDTRGDLEVVYRNNYTVNCGNAIPFLKTTRPPVVTFKRGNCRLMSIIMFDPDAIGLPNFLHWFVANIPCDIMKNGYSVDKKAGCEFAKYFPPLAPTDSHRYTFCIYCQTGCIRKADRDGLVQRLIVSPKDVSKQGSLSNPKACNFFYASILKSDKTKLVQSRKLENLKRKLLNKDEVL